MELADCAAVVPLLTKGYRAWRDAAFWTRALQRLADRVPPAGLPRFGYVLERAGEAVGVLLLIASEAMQDGRPVRRCNVSSLYVEPEFRLYGSLLVRQALRHREVTYMNVSPAPETWALLAAQGYQRYVSGRTVAMPLLARAGAGRVSAAGPELLAGPDLPEWEAALLREHAGWDCLILVCMAPGGRVPFVFGLRRRRGILPFVYLVYCRGLDSVSAYARPLGRYLARRGIAFVVADADARLPGMPGWFQDGYPKYFKGGEPPRPGDLAYTERAMFGV